MPDIYAAEPRTTLGKSVAALRRTGVLPANIYGRGVDSTAVQLATREAQTILKQHGFNSLVNLQVTGEAAPRTVVIRSTQRHPVNQQLQHLDFLQVDVDRKMQAHIPVVLTGEAPAVAAFKSVLTRGADTVLVEALPGELPAHLEVSVNGLATPDSEVTVSDLVAPTGVTILSPADQMLARASGGRVTTEEVVPEGEQKVAKKK